MATSLPSRPDDPSTLTANAVGVRPALGRRTGPVVAAASFPLLATFSQSASPLTHTTRRERAISPHSIVGFLGLTGGVPVQRLLHEATLFVEAG